MKLTMVAKFGVAPGGTGDPVVLDRILVRVMAVLERLHNVEDPDLTASLATGDVSIMVTVEAPDSLAAAASALAAIRTAFHATGVATPEWPTFTGTELVDLVDA
jgi:hypothetical protein